MLKRGGERDIARAAVWFVRWWREEGCAFSATAPILDPIDPPSEGAVVSPLPHGDSGVQRGGWGFDFQWEFSDKDVAGVSEGAEAERLIQQEMERVIDAFIERAEAEAKDGGDVSVTQQKKRDKELLRAKREKRIKEVLTKRRPGKS